MATAVPSQSWLHRARWPALLLAGLVAVVLLPFVAGGEVQLDQGVRLVRAEIPREVAPGGAATLRFRFQPARALPGNWWVFTHIEGTASGRPNCRVVQDRPPSPVASAWSSQPVDHEVSVTFPESCVPGRLEVFAGLYERSAGDRLAVLRPRTLDNRVRVGAIDVVAAGADSAPRVLEGADVVRAEYVGLLEPWRAWLAALAAAALLAVFVGARLRAAGAREEDAALPRPLRWGALLVPATLFVVGVLTVLEFVKDDAYISFRYAHNLVRGEGLVFNPGERLEGFTNFLWTLLLVPFEALGWDLFQVCEVLGTALTLGLLYQTARTAKHLSGERRDLSHLWGATWLASSSSLVVWSKSGLEQPLSTLLPFLAAWLVFTIDARDARAALRRGVLAGVVAALGCMTRPEIHLIAAILGVALLVDAVRVRRVTPALAGYAVAVVALVAPFHAFRWFYYHSLLPNTFYVKTGTGDLIWRAGLRMLNDMFSFNHVGLLAVLVPFAFSDGARRREKLVMLAVAGAFMAYVVKVGADEMHWHRLYLPALPFLVALATAGLRNVGDAFARLGRHAKLAVALAGWTLVALGAADNFNVTWREYAGLNGHGDLSGMYHPDMGKFITRHERPGALVAFQDMGSTPYHAPDVSFLDFIGLTDGTVARARHNYGLHAFVPMGEGRQQSRFDAEMREYFFRRDPEWAILTVYPPADMQDRIARDFAADPSPRALGSTYAGNPYQFGIWNDQRFHQNYVHVRTWPRSRGYYLSLFRRRDLWAQTPGEVVLDAPPASLRGVRATFEGGVELLGSELQPTTIERHEAFITTWFRLPGPMPEDTTFFVHVSRPGFQAPMDHLPGDWMYPADRWRQGQILEDRVLFQLPIEMAPGTYDVYFGIYRRSTGQRLHITAGPNDGADRLLLGRLEVRRMLPVVHQLIPPTRVDEMRRHPERIVRGRPHR